MYQPVLSHEHKEKEKKARKKVKWPNHHPHWQWNHAQSEHAEDEATFCVIFWLEFWAEKKKKILHMPTHTQRSDGYMNIKSLRLW